MGEVTFLRLQPAFGTRLAPGPWTAKNDGTILDANGRPVCVLGCPEDDMAEQDVTNGAAILALPMTLDALRRLHHGARPANWDDDEDPDQLAAWRALDAALAAAGIAP